MEMIKKIVEIIINVIDAIWLPMILFSITTLMYQDINTRKQIQQQQCQMIQLQKEIQDKLKNDKALECIIVKKENK